MGKSTINGPCSIAMLNYQMVAEICWKITIHEQSLVKCLPWTSARRTTTISKIHFVVIFRCAEVGPSNWSSIGCYPRKGLLTCSKHVLWNLQHQPNYISASKKTSQPQMKNALVRSILVSRFRTNWWKPWIWRNYINSLTWKKTILG